MLVLTRQSGETIVIDDNIRVTVLSVQGKKVRLGITAPESVRIDRKEIIGRRVAQHAVMEATDLPIENKPDRGRLTGYCGPEYRTF